MQDPNQPSDNETVPARGSETMMANLRKDVTDWNKARHANEGMSSVASTEKPAQKRPARAPKLPATAPQPAQAVDGKKAPFSMSYDGVSAAQHAAKRHLLGAR